MRALIYDPYLDTAGGGERYMLTAACVLLGKGYEVDVWWKDPKIGNWLEPRLGIGFKDINFVDKTNHGIGYDLVFWLSDGSLPLLLGGKNFVHFQTPFINVQGKSLFNRLKRLKIDGIVCNSSFTKSFIDKEFGVESSVVYPPINTKLFKKTSKENLIVVVGRYSQLQQRKRQDILISTFKKMCQSGLGGWKLTLIGGSEVGGREYVRKLKEMSEGYPISVLENQPISKVQEAYGEAKIFWSASGYGVDEEENPSKVEHFGMSVVEAMSASCVPVIINKGGHKETVSDGIDGLLWGTTEELMEKTLQLVKDERRRERLAKKALQASKRFSTHEFEKKVIRVFTG